MVSLVSIQKIKGAQTDDFQETGNVFSYNTPYTLSYNMNGGPNADMFVITITGNLASITQITFVGLDNVIMLDAINYTSGSGFYSSVTKNSTVTNLWYTNYDKWYNVMSMDVSNLALTTTLVIQFHYTLSSGVTSTQFRQGFLEVVSLYFNDTIDIAQLINDAYNNGYNDAIRDYGDNYDVIYDEGYNDGHSVGYNDGYNDGLSSDLDVKPLFNNLISFIGSVFMLTIFPGVTIGVLVSIPISFALFKWFMRMFGGK